MNSPMIIWYGLVGLVLLGSLIPLLHYLHSSHSGGHPRHKLVGTYKERDLLFIPGDRLHVDDDDEYDD